jgi:hypothetical protein
MTTSPLLINEPPLQILPTLAKIVGLNEAIVLQQVHYWLNPHFNSNFFEERYWVHNTLTQWQKQFVFWSRKTIKRTIASLEESGLLVSFVTRGFKKTKYYTLNYDLLDRVNLSNAHHAHSVQTRVDYDPGYEIEGEAEENDLNPPKNPLANQVNYPSSQKLLMDWSECPGQSEQDERINLAKTPLKLEEMAEKQGAHSWGQNDPFDGVKMTLSMGSKCPSRWGQNDPLDGVNLTPSLNTEITSENTNTTPLLPLSCPSSARSNPSKVVSQPKPEPEDPQEEDEEENKNRKIKNAGKQQQPCQQMVDFWNQSVQSKIYAGQEVRLTEKRKELLNTFLVTILEDKFPSEKLDGWRNYCSLIAQSRFLAGNNSSGFKVTLDWALVPNNAWKILEGAIYDKPEPASRPKDLPWEAFSEELARMLPTGKYLSSWLKISIALAKMIGQTSYKSWFAKVSLEELTETKATFFVEGNFMRDYISTHFSRDILRAVQLLCPNVTQIDFRARPLEGGAYQNGRMRLVPAKAEWAQNNGKKGENECNQR